MPKQRITLINTSPNNSNLLQDLNATDVVLSPTESFIQETKVSYNENEVPSVLKIEGVEKLRIHLIQQNYDIPPFNQQYQKGLNIYLEADNENQTKIINELFGVEDQWIVSHNSYFLHQSEFNPNTFNVFGILGDLVSNIDILYQRGKGAYVSSLRETKEPVRFSLDKNQRKEVGLFSADKYSSLDDTIFTGLRIVLDPERMEEKNAHQTLFHIKPRHRNYPGSYKQYIRPNGLHPVLVTEFDSPLTVPDDEDIKECKLYLYVDLEKSVFLDQYQLPSVLDFVLMNGRVDLEAPEYSFQQWGNEIILEINSNSSLLELPLHSRYHKPNDGKASVRKTVNNPIIFYGCDVSDHKLLFDSPFDTKKPIGGNYQHLFTDDAVYYHFSHNDSSLEVDIPVASGNVEVTMFLTFGSIVIGFLYIMSKLIRFSVKPREKQD